MRDILIVGATSLVGSRIVRNLAGKYAFHLASRRGHSNLTVDLATIQPLVFPRAYSVVIHCAAAFGGDSPEDMIRNEVVNSVGALRVALAAKEARCRHLIYIGSIFSCDSPSNSHFNSYGISKLHGHENQQAVCHKGGVKFCSLWPSQLYDNECIGRKHQAALYSMVDRAREGKDIVINGKTDPLRNYLHVDDLVRIIERIIELGAIGTYYCVAPKSHTISEVARIAQETFGRGGSVLRNPSAPDIGTIFIPDGQPLYDAVNFTPERDLASGMRAIRAFLEGGAEC